MCKESSLGDRAASVFGEDVLKGRHNDGFIDPILLDNFPVLSFSWIILSSDIGKRETF